MTKSSPASTNPRWLSESDVRNQWSTMFKGGVSPVNLEAAERLIELIRPESPLKFRLVTELAELRKMTA